MAVSKKPKYKLLCPKGKTLSQPLDITDGTDPIDLTGYTARIEVRSQLPTDTSTADDDDVLIRLTTENDGITIDGAEGRVTILIDAETTATFDEGTYFWELELVSPTGFIPYFMQPSSFVVLSENTL